MTKYISDIHICLGDPAFGGAEELTTVSPSLSKRGGSKGVSYKFRQELTFLSLVQRAQVHVRYHPWECAYLFLVI